MARHADPIAEIEQFEDLKVSFRQRILTKVNLDARRSVRQHQEVRLSEAANGKDATRRPHVKMCRGEIFPALGAVLGDDGCDGCLGFETMRVWLDTELRQLLEIRATLRNLIGFFTCAHSRSSVRRMLS